MSELQNVCTCEYVYLAFAAKYETYIEYEPSRFWIFANNYFTYKKICELGIYKFFFSH